jgi:hypothetical protein
MGTTGDPLVYNTQGTFTVHWTFNDGNGNSSFASQNVIVKDTIAPVITRCPADITVPAGPGQTVCGQVVTWATPTASDNCGVVSFTSNHAPGETFPVGTTKVTYTAIDVGGNQSICSFKVIVTKDNTIASNFNGTAIPGNSYLWFSSVLKPSGLNATPGPVTVKFFNQKIASSNFSLSVPDTTVIFDPNATFASSAFINGQWVVRTPKSGLSGNTFLSGLAYKVPVAGLPGGIKPVNWSGTFMTDTAGVSVNWQWATAVYSNFTTDLGALAAGGGVKATDDTKGDLTTKNSDHAGTPEQYKSKVIGGAMGGGGSNYTGSLSGTNGVVPCDTL